LIRTTITALAGSLLIALTAPVAAPAATYPPGFEEETVVEGLTRPAAVDWAPDGRMFVAEKDGRLKVVAPGASTAETVLDLRSRVNSYWDRGLLGLAVDPDFASNGFVYLAYTYDLAPLTPDDEFPAVSQLLRLELNAAGDVTEQVVLLGTHTIGPCPAPSNSVDCLPSDGWSHSIGTVRADPDGTLWLGSGDAADMNVDDGVIFRTLDERSMSGKILHVDREGRGLPGHPYCRANDDLDDVCTKVYAHGFRNPFRFSLRPDGGPAVGDVGQNQWEEVNLLAPGRGFGWPCYEGTNPMEGYDQHPRCHDEYDLEGRPAAHLPPVHEYSHDISGNGGGAVVMGPTFAGGEYPPGYQDSLFFGDYVNGFMKRISFGPGGEPTVHAFADGWEGVAIEQSPGGDLVYVDFGGGDAGTGSVKRIAYSLGNARPTAEAAASPAFGPAPLEVAFSGGGSSDPEHAELEYAWDFGDETPGSSLADPSHTYEAGGVYIARLTVTDPGGKSDSDTVRIDVGNSPPRPVIEAPLNYAGGEGVDVSGGADDAESGPLPDTALEWNVKLVHGSHVHVAGTWPGEASLGFTAQDDHDSDSHYEVSLTATDPDGLSATATAAILPRLAPLRIQSVPPGAPVSYAGSPFTAPVEIDSAVGFRALISADETFSTGGLGYDFLGWGDGEPEPLRVVRIPEDGAELTARYGAHDARPADPGTGDPGQGEPGAGDPGQGDPGAGDPGQGDPGQAAPGSGDIGSQGVSPGPAHDRKGPVIGFDRDKGLDVRRGRLSGTARDGAGVTRVSVGLTRYARGGCRPWRRSPGGLATRRQPCSEPAWMRARLSPHGSATAWSASLGRTPVPVGRYRVIVKARDGNGNVGRRSLSLRVRRR
jgi:glucose/arabinose dehydrogenase/PKD repeat protein